MSISSTGTLNGTTGCIPRVRRAGAVTAVLAGLAVCLSACGGGTAPSGVASLGSTTTTTTPAGGGSPAPGLRGNPENREKAVLEYVSCMHTHGDPSFTSQFASSTSSLEYARANKACEHLLPNGGAPPLPPATAANVTQSVKWAQCMRRHGIPDFPDPTTTSTGGLIFKIPAGIDMNSPTAQAATKACQSIAPSGGLSFETPGTNGQYPIG